MSEKSFDEDDEIQIIQVSDTVYATEDELDQAHAAAEALVALGEAITPLRMLIASLVVVMMLSSVFAAWYWVIPRDAVEVEVVYMQAGGGHVVLAQVHNLGSRAIHDVSVEISFSDSEGVTLSSTIFYREDIGAHLSIASDDLELSAPGVTVWSNYEIRVTLNYEDGRGDVRSQTWHHPVGDWVYEEFMDEGPKHLLLL